MNSCFLRPEQPVDSALSAVPELSMAPELSTAPSQPELSLAPNQLELCIAPNQAIRVNPSVPKAVIRAKLQRVFGYTDFRPPQEEIVQCLLEQRDALIILPTGAGKSLCFQLPALLQSGLTLVVSPLVALMENQVKELEQRNLPVAVLHSELPRYQYKRVLWLLRQQQLRLLYLAPETLLNPTIWELLCAPELTINGVILDEAHCLVQWGETFRPVYHRLGAVRPALLQHKPPGSAIAVAAFTATADPQTQQAIQQILRLENPQIVRLNPYRANLQLEVKTVWTPRQRRQAMLKFIQCYPMQTGLVYVRTRRTSEELADWLRQQGIRAMAYHAGLEGGDRRQIEQAWLANALDCVVCTNAFGLGINKPDCRWVVHFHAPLLLAEYIQEVGRAGRDGQPATALTLISEPTGWLDPEDKQRRQFFEHQMDQHHRTAQALIAKLPSQGNVRLISKQFKEGAQALSMLHGMGRLEWLDPFHYLIRPVSRPSSNQRWDLGSLNFWRSNSERSQFVQSNSQAAQSMGDYLKTHSCRWQFLLRAFGFNREAQGLHCGHCDRCCMERAGHKPGSVL